MAKKLGIEDSLFVQVVLEKTQAKTLRKEWKTQKKQHFLKNYPYFTFSEVEQLFESWGAKDVQIERLALARLDAKGKPTTEGELQLSPFILEDSYENLLKVFAEALLNDPSYGMLTFEEKVNYLETTLFPAYQKSTGCADTQLPILPEYPDEAFMTCEVPFYASEGQSEIHPQGSAFEAEVPPQKEAPEDEGEEEKQDCSPYEEAENQPQGQHKNQYKNQRESHYQPPCSSSQKHPTLYGLTYFKCRKPQALDRAHPDYVENELSKQKESINQKIKVLDEEWQALQVALLRNKKAALESEKNQGLHDWLTVHDQRSLLKAQLWTKGKAKVEALEATFKAEKAKAKAHALEEARVAYERQVEEIEGQFHQEIQRGIEALYEEQSAQLTALYQEEYAQQTAELQHGFSREVALIEEKQAQEVNQLMHHMQEVLQEKDRQIQKMYQETLEHQRQVLENVHQIALAEQREEEKTEAVLGFQEEVKAVRNQTQALAQEIQHSKEKQEKLLYSIVPRAPQVQEKHEPSEERKETGVEKESFGPLMLVALSALTLVMGSSYFFFQMML